MSKIHLDSYCYKYAHSKDDEVPAKCTEYPETLYSLSLSKGYDKAKNTYENKCQEKYIKGLENL